MLDLCERFHLPPLAGKWQHICKSKKGIISIIEIPSFLSDKSMWEIYPLKGKFPDFETPKRYETLKQAKKICEAYLD